jgi:hypothetical protein
VDFGLGILERAYERAPERLVELTIPLTVEIARLLGSQTRFHVASDMNPREGKNERLIDIVAALGGTIYVSGPSAAGYIEPALWEARGIEVQFFKYAEYPAYPQLGSHETPELSILDLLCMKGQEARYSIWPNR